ncbi:hypothetical protein BKA61DRAFT_569192 [Leptodontidium sp. MPI-SDFR-AT-0119]|nr:hypothetical protein BKA61DRAFT_569192 [Leptodontidium sp. MPI-SDFR-AT-0119]
MPGSYIYIRYCMDPYLCPLRRQNTSLLNFELRRYARSLYHPEYLINAKICHFLDRGTGSDNEWTEYNGDVLRCVQPEVQAALALSKHLRHGFINIFFYIAEVIESQVIPSTGSIRKNAWGMRENVPHVPRFLSTSSTTEAEIQIVFEMARDSDEWAGDGDHQEEFKIVHEDLPKCRNDHEWELVARMCGLRELPQAHEF